MERIKAASGTPAGVRYPKTRLPVVVPPLPHTTTGYLLATLRVGSGCSRENVRAYSAMAGTQSRMGCPRRVASNPLAGRPVGDMAIPLTAAYSALIFRVELPLL